MKEIILKPDEIEKKIERIAYQILESNLDFNKIFIAGIAKNGFHVAEKIVENLKIICDKEIILCKVNVDKKNPQKKIITSLGSEIYKNVSVTIVDDVLHTGTTLIYVVKHFLEVKLKQCKTAVLINRNHKLFPIKADFKGLSFSTSINKNIEVNFENNKLTAYLNYFFLKFVLQLFGIH